MTKKKSSKKIEIELQFREPAVLIAVPRSVLFKLRTYLRFVESYGGELQWTDILDGWINNGQEIIFADKLSTASARGVFCSDAVLSNQSKE